MKCNDCDKEADPQYTMDFSDVEPGAKIYWCSEHGPEAHALDDALMNKMEEDPSFAPRLKEALDEAQRKIN